MDENNTNELQIQTIAKMFRQTSCLVFNKISGKRQLLHLRLECTALSSTFLEHNLGFYAEHLAQKESAGWNNERRKTAIVLKSGKVQERGPQLTAGEFRAQIDFKELLKTISCETN